MAAALAMTSGGVGIAASTSSRHSPPVPVKTRPGPPILYRAPAKAPQLQNTGIWHAKPILVSGASAYRDGEYLYQDYLYDDHGARFTKDPNDPRENNDFSAPNGTYTYPTSIASANAADLVEVRVKPLAHATAFRFTLNSLDAKPEVGISVALGGEAGQRYAFPFGANTSAPADAFLTLKPSGAGMTSVITSAETGKEIGGSALMVAVDHRKRQITAWVPHDYWNPGKTERIAAAVGLWDGQHDRYLVPGDSASATTPGGAGFSSKPSAFFNVAFRFHEPTPEFGVGIAEQTAGNTTWWRDRDQGTELATGDISALFAEVDFGKLDRRVTDNSDVPTTGNFDRILASHFEPHQGVRYDESCYGGGYHCQYQGQLQPYAIYVPEKAPPKSGYGMTLLLHANAANYNEFLASRNAQQFGDRGTGSIVITPEARDPGSSYIGLAAADVFEVWADAARHYDLDPTWRSIAGYSLGGLGTFKLAEQWPDLFSRAVAIVGSPGTPVNAVPQSEELASLRNIPVMVWDVIPVDELNPYSEINVVALQQLGYRYDYLAFPGEHLTPAVNDDYAEAAAFLGTTRVDRNPAHITYVYGKDTLDGLFRSTGDFAKWGVVADHAYWLSGLEVRSHSTSCQEGQTPGCGATASIDAVSAGFGVGAPEPSGPQPGGGVQTGGAAFPVLPYAEVQQTWGKAPTMPRKDVLTLNATNLASVTVDVARARLTCDAEIHAVTDGPLTVHLDGCDRTVHIR
jgi:pimeloyl-ACP methyl ester carboxylesterase